MFQNEQILLWLKLQEKKNPELSMAIKVSKNWAHSWNPLHTEDSNGIWKERNT